MKEARLGTVCESVCPAATGVQSLRMPHIPSIPRRSVPPRGAVRALPATMLPAPFSCRPRREGSGDVESVESKSRDVARSRVASGSTLYTLHTLHQASYSTTHSSSTRTPRQSQSSRRATRTCVCVAVLLSANDGRRLHRSRGFKQWSHLIVPVLVAPRHVE
jgi:aminoglycoside phosphotransferase (APT) family kinase protein